MITRVVAALLTTLLAGCVYYPPYQYVADPQGDYYYQAEPDGYGYGSVGYGYGYAGYGGCGYGYGWWPYYGAAWPCYSYWPGYGFYYGVTWFPRWGWGWYDHWAWYHPYSPYRHSYYDHYYDYQGDWRRHHDGDAPRFGSASNEAERLANMAPRASSAGAGGYGGGAPMGAPRWSRERDAGGGYSDIRGNAVDPRGYGGGWRGRDAGGWRQGYTGTPQRYAPAPGNSGGRGQMPHRSSSPSNSGGSDRGGGVRSAPTSRPWSESHSSGRERDPG